MYSQKAPGITISGGSLQPQPCEDHHLYQDTDPQRQRRKGGQSNHQLAVRRAGARLQLRGDVDADEDGEGQCQMAGRIATGQATRNSGTVSQLDTCCVR